MFQAAINKILYVHFYSTHVHELFFHTVQNRIGSSDCRQWQEKY